MAVIAGPQVGALAPAARMPLAATRAAACRAVLLPFLASRALLALITIAAPWWVALLRIPWVAPPGHAGVAADWYRWDAQWYMRVAVDGYRASPYANGHVNLAFFPLFPLAIHAWLWLWPWSRALGAMAVANLCSFGALYALYRLLDLEFGGERARRTIWLLALFPTSFFFAAGYSESLFLLCLVLCFYQLRLRHWWQAGMWGALATLTRSLGIIALAPFLVAWLEANPDARRALLRTIGARGLRLPTRSRGYPDGSDTPGTRLRVSVGSMPLSPEVVRRGSRLFDMETTAVRGRRRVATLGAAALIPGSLGALMLYLWARFGTPLAFSAAQRSWHRAWAWPWQTLQAALARPLAGFPHLTSTQMHACFDTLWAIVFLALTLPAARQLPRRYVAFLAAFWLAVLCTPALLDGAVDPLISLPRFLLTAFPLLIYLAGTPRRAGVALAVSLPLLILDTGTFVSGGWVA